MRVPQVNPVLVQVEEDPNVRSLDRRATTGDLGAPERFRAGTFDGRIVVGALRRSMPVLAAVIVVAGCAPPGIVNSGRLVRLDSGEICIEEPDGNRKCFPTEEETVIPARIGIGDVVSVRVVEGRAKEVEIATPG